jgi:hypothetical protein
MRAISTTIFMLCAITLGASAASNRDESALTGFKLVASASLPKFIGSWKGTTVCPRLGSSQLQLEVRQQDDGSYITRASTDGAGEFGKMVFRNDSISLGYSSIFKDTTYTGRLTTPDRMEGTVKIQEDCTWFMTRSS